MQDSSRRYALDSPLSTYLLLCACQHVGSRDGCLDTLWLTSHGLLFVQVVLPGSILSGV